MVSQKRILVVVLRRLGDVLLTTALIRALKSGIPNCSIDVLVFRGTEGMLAGNPDIARVIAIPERPSPAEALRTIGALWRRYDLSFATQTGDRPMFFAWAAGRRRIGFVADNDTGAWWKTRALQHAVTANADNHRVAELLRLIEPLGLPRRAELVPPAGSDLQILLPARPYAVLHANPMFRIRQWTDEGWRLLARALHDRGLAVIATGGPAAAEKAYLDRVWNSADPPVVRLNGRLAWPELVTLLRGAAVYVGPDTSMSHLAAAVGAPTVAIYGPESPSRIGPWPVGTTTPPWAPSGAIQHQGNVWVVQNPLPCMPCNLLGCERHLESYSACLDMLPLSQVMRAVDEALAT